MFTDRPLSTNKGSKSPLAGRTYSLISTALFFFLPFAPLHVYIRRCSTPNYHDPPQHLPTNRLERGTGQETKQCYIWYLYPECPPPTHTTTQRRHVMFVNVLRRNMALTEPCCCAGPLGSLVRPASPRCHTAETCCCCATRRMARETLRAVKGNGRDKKKSGRV